MKEYKGHAGCKVVIDGQKIFIKEVFLSEECELGDIVNATFKEPISSLLYGTLKIKTKKRKYTISFLKADLDKFKELYVFLCKHVSINKCKEETKETEKSKRIFKSPNITTGKVISLIIIIIIATNIMNGNFRYFKIYGGYKRATVVNEIGSPLRMKDFEFTIDSFKELEGRGSYNPTEGNIFVQIVFTVENLSNRTYSIIWTDFLNVSYDGNSIRNSTKASLIDKSFQNVGGRIEPGRKFTNQLCFELPIDWKGLEINTWLDNPVNILNTKLGDDFARTSKFFYSDGWISIRLNPSLLDDK